METSNLKMKWKKTTFTVEHPIPNLIKIHSEVSEMNHADA
jgi:hypothetical protein